LVFDPNVPGSLERRCTEMLDPDVRRRFARAAKERGVRRWSYDEAVRGWTAAAMALAESPVT
jgi:hypothetical protein